MCMAGWHGKPIYICCSEVDPTCSLLQHEFLVLFAQGNYCITCNWWFFLTKPWICLRRTWIQITGYFPRQTRFRISGPKAIETRQMVQRKGWFSCHWHLGSWCWLLKLCYPNSVATADRGACVSCHLSAQESDRNHPHSCELVYKWRARDIFREEAASSKCWYPFYDASFLWLFTKNHSVVIVICHLIIW